MNIYTGEKIRNIALLAHSKAGKTSLIEAMLFNTGAISRMGKTDDGNTVCDYDSEEIKRAVSIRASLATIEHANHKINFVDTPGYFDFIGDMYGAISACDLGLIVASGKSGAKVGGEIAFKQAGKANMPVMFFINKMDHENCDH
ncbi:MAG: GTP-binding protein, partial [Monoglobales bacterium]